MTATVHSPAPADSPPPAQRRRGTFGGRIRALASPKTVPYLLMAPAVVAILALLGYPVVSALLVSFRKLDLTQLVHHRTVWIGIANYEEILSSPEFWSITIRTVLFTVACVVATLLGGLVMAMLIKHSYRGVRLALQIVLLLAWAMPIIAATTVFQWIFDQNYGILNKTLVGLGLDSFAGYNWFSTGLSTLVIIGMLITWQAMPFAALTLYAGLLAVPGDLYEAAAIDGAGRWQAFRSVTWPALRPILVLTVFLELLWDIRAFTQVWAIRQGGPAGGSTTLPVLQYLKGISGHHYGIAAAVSVLLIAIIVVLTAQYIRLLVRSQEVKL